MRHFYTYHPESGEPIQIVQGESGYSLITSGTDIAFAKLNEMNENNEADLEIALHCSMFGWDIPKHKELSISRFMKIDQVANAIINCRDFCGNESEAIEDEFFELGIDQQSSEASDIRFEAMEKANNIYADCAREIS